MCWDTYKKKSRNITLSLLHLLVVILFSVKKIMSMNRFFSFLTCLIFLLSLFYSVSIKINLYLLSRIIFGLIRVAQKKKLIPKPKQKTFPWFAAFVWAVVLWLFEHHQKTLQPSLQASMTYLYHDSNTWDSLKNFFVYNK